MLILVLLIFDLASDQIDVPFYVYLTMIPVAIVWNIINAVVTK